MAHDSGREQIIVKIVSILEEINDMRKVERQHPSDEELTEKYPPPTHMPFTGVLASLPILDEDLSQEHIQQWTSDIIISLKFWAQAPKDPDKWISYYLDEIWREIHKHPTLDGLCEKVTIEPDIVSRIKHPYIVFFVYVTVTYTHEDGI